MGYDFLDKQDADKIPLIDQPQVRETINWFLKWRDRYGKPDLDGFRTAFTGTTDAYVAGKNPMQVHGVWMPARYALNQPKFRQAWALHPKHTSPNATHASWGDGAALIIPVKCKNPAGGWEWIEYVESLENQVRWCTVTGYYSGQLGPMKDARVPKAAGAHWPLAVQQLELTKARRNFSGVDVHYQVHTAMLDVWDGKKTLDQSLKDKQAEIKTAILDWRKTHPGMI
jgi:ABC-type glycerol-3-phosphate transport system substrate-binding protein